jgi:hypothetical protein
LRRKKSEILEIDIGMKERARRMRGKGISCTNMDHM